MLQINSTKPDMFTPKIVEKKDDYVRAEYESRILGVSVTRLQYQYGNISFFPRKEQVGMLTRSLCSQFVDDVEFWFPPGKKSVVEYRSASRVGNYDFDINRKRIKVIILSTLIFCFCAYILSSVISNWSVN